MSVETWAIEARQDKWRQVFKHQRAIDTVQGLLEGNITSDTAAGIISSLYEPSIKLGPNPSPVATLWVILCDAVRVLGGNQELGGRLIDLLNSISQLPDVTNKHGNVITPAWNSAGVYWRDLPELTIMFREYGIDIDPEDGMEEDHWDEQAVPLLNATTFGAMYLARGNKSLGMPFHAEVSLKQGIEVHCQTPGQQGYAAMYVPPAATWILFAGEKIYELCKSDYNRKDYAPGSTLDLWGKGWGYSLGRWMLWKERFGEIMMTQGLQNGVKDLAARANSEMVKIESRLK